MAAISEEAIVHAIVGLLKKRVQAIDVAYYSALGQRVDREKVSHVRIDAHIYLEQAKTLIEVNSINELLACIDPIPNMFKHFVVAGRLSARSPVIALAEMLLTRYFDQQNGDDASGDPMQSVDPAHLMIDFADQVVRAAETLVGRATELLKPKGPRAAMRRALQALRNAFRPA